VPLSKAVCVKGKYYRVEVAPDGSSIKFEKYEPKMGTLDIGTAASLTLMSDTGMHNLSGADGKWQVPEGRYTCQSLSITRTDADGKQWLLIASNVGPLRTFEVRGGETTTIGIGPPLTLKVAAFGPQVVRTVVGVEGGGSASAPQPSEPQQGPISLSVALAGKGGEMYSLAIRKDARGEVRPPPPKIKISDASGKVLAEGNLDYG
jgi:hypothetical protein